MKRTPIYTVLAALMAFVSCTDHLGGEGVDGYISLSVNSIDMHTKADVQGVEAYNENLLGKLDIYFFVDGGAEGGQNSLMHYTCAPGSQITGSVNIPTGEAFVNTQLIPSPHTACDVYVVANCPVTLPETATLASLRAQALSADFVSTVKQSTFVMEGLGHANITQRTAKIMASGTIPVYRVANKLTLNVSVEQEVVASSEPGAPTQTWTPEVAGLKVRYFNAVSGGSIGAGNIDISDATRFNNPMGSGHTEQSGRSWTGTTTVGGRTAYSFEPFYSYPSRWEMGDNNQPYLMVSIPWTTTVNGNQRTINCFYKLLLKGTSFDRNVWQVINFHLGALGALTEEAPTVPTTQEYYSLDWGHVGSYEYYAVEAEIKGARYLVVEQDVYHVDNKDTETFSFKSSHNCEIVDVSCWIYDYSRQDVSTKTVSGAASWLSVDNNNKTFTIRHILDNNTAGTTYDITPYNVTFTIRHEDDHAYYETVTIIQSPAIVVTAEKNPGGNTVGGEARGYVFVYKNQLYSGSDWQVVRGLTGGNKNPNMYTITTTVLGEESEFILADARQAGTVTGSSMSIGNADSNTGKTLQQYHKTITTGDARYVISPQFRMASSYGVCGQAISYDEAVRRCAAYQERGYPAGRWRVPTYAELKYVAQLSAKGKIPQLYSDGGKYWTSVGLISYGTNPSYPSSTSGSAYVRCVYDEWYWNNTSEPRLEERDYGKYTWGDQPR